MYVCMYVCMYVGMADVCVPVCPIHLPYLHTHIHYLHIHKLHPYIASRAYMHTYVHMWVCIVSCDQKHNFLCSRFVKFEPTWSERRNQPASQPANQPFCIHPAENQQG